jgi:tetratricopeptide (TPR) repeat protein
MKSFILASLACSACQCVAAVDAFAQRQMNSTDEPTRGAVLRIISQIQHADYEGNQAEMQKGYDELKSFVGHRDIRSRVRYWRGFAQWRRAMNGFNDSVDPKEIEKDLKQALDEFSAATALDPGFVEAKIGIVSSYGNLAFLNRNDQAQAQELIAKSVPILKEARATAPDNPRLLWVLGPILWRIPIERGGGQSNAIENYKRGLQFARNAKSSTSADSLDPSWGRPELLMNLAWSFLNKDTPDLDAAERYARSALELVPYWHYVRDVLLPQILAAKAKGK